MANDGQPCPACRHISCPCFEAGVRNLETGTSGLIAAVQWTLRPDGTRSLGVRVGSADDAVLAAWATAAGLTDLPHISEELKAWSCDFARMLQAAVGLIPTARALAKAGGLDIRLVRPVEKT